MPSRLLTFLSRSILSGMLLIMPPILAVGILFWIVMFLEDYTRPIILWLIPPSWYWPGAGALAALALMLVVGILARNTLLKRLLELLQQGLEALPVLGPLYRALRDLSAMLADNDSPQTASRPVMVHFPDLQVSMLGLELPQSVDTRLPASDDQVLIYLPMTYQIGGFMVRVPREWLEPLSMSSMEALQYIIGGGIGAGRGQPAEMQDKQPGG